MFLILCIYGYGHGPVTYMLIADYLPDKGSGLAIMNIWVLILLLSAAFPLIIVTSFGITGCFWFFAAC